MVRYAIWGAVAVAISGHIGGAVARALQAAFPVLL